MNDRRDSFATALFDTHIIKIENSVGKGSREVPVADTS